VLKKFFSGAIFGAGFSIVTLCLYTVWMFYMLPSLIDKNMSSEIVLTENPNPIQNFTNTQNFDELSVDEKIELATAIIIVKFEEDKNGNYKSVVDEILKKEEGVELYYNIGEEYENNSHYKVSNKFVPSRAIVFMQGNPASMRFSTTFNGDRIRGLGGITLALLREKCSNT